ARAARRADAAHWRAAAGRAGRRGISILARSVPAGARSSGLDHRTQYTDRNTVDQIRRRGNAQICGRTGGARAGGHRRDWQLNGGPLVGLTRTVPIVFPAAADPVATGLVESLARSGGNATGFMTLETGMSAKWLELLKEIAPGVKRAAVLRTLATA